MEKMTNEKFIIKANIIHNNKYSYSKLEYKSSTKKVIITCKEHGDFIKEANSHLRGIGCPKCSGVYRMSSIEFINKCSIIHNNKYDYSLVEYKSMHKKIKIICKEHGDFLQTPINHINLHGCKKCGIDIIKIKNTKKLDDFLEKSNLKHGNKYDYSLSNYINAKTKIIIICREHGPFEQEPHSHLSGRGLNNS